MDFTDHPTLLLHFLWCRESSKETIYRSPNPLSQEGFEPPLQTSSPNHSWTSQAAKPSGVRGLIDFGDRSPPSRFWYGSLAFVPTGFAIFSIRSDHQRSGVFFIYGPQGLALIIYTLELTPRGVGARSPMKGAVMSKLRS